MAHDDVILDSLRFITFSIMLVHSSTFRYHLRMRFFGKIRKRICHPRSYGFFNTKETQNPKKDYFVMTGQAGARNIYVRTIFLSYCPRIQLEWNTNNL